MRGEEKKTSVNNGPLCLQTQPRVAYANRLDHQKVIVNNGQICLRTAPWVVHASCLDQNQLPGYPLNELKAMYGERKKEKECVSTMAS